MSKGMNISIACGFICGLIEEAVLSGFQTVLSSPRATWGCGGCSPCVSHLPLQSGSPTFVVLHIELYLKISFEQHVWRQKPLWGPILEFALDNLIRILCLDAVTTWSSKDPPNAPDFSYRHVFSSDRNASLYVMPIYSPCKPLLIKFMIFPMALSVDCFPASNKDTKIPVVIILKRLSSGVISTIFLMWNVSFLNIEGEDVLSLLTPILLTTFSSSEKDELALVGFCTCFMLAEGSHSHQSSHQNLVTSVVCPWELQALGIHSSTHAFNHSFIQLASMECLFLQDTMTTMVISALKKLTV